MHNHLIYTRKSARHGGVLITTLIISTIVASMIAGLGSLLTSYYSRSMDETNYVSAINLAEAGINYEIRRISASVSNADLPGTGTLLGTTVTFGNGSFRVYCTMSDGSTTWDKSTIPFCIISTGISASESRTVKISCTSNYNSGGTASIFAVTSGTANGNPTMTGTVATNGTLSFYGNPTVTGDVVFNGSGAGWAIDDSINSYTKITNPNAVTWPTVSQIALSQFPATGATAPGGLTYLSLHNDNLTASPIILLNTLLLSGSSTTTLVGKPGGANYYLTSLAMSGSGTFAFNNTNGPITVWVGPAGGSGTFTLSGGVAAVKMSTNPANAVRFYVATTSGVTLTGNSELDAGVYNVTGAGATTTIEGTANLYGTVICDKFIFNGTPDIIATAGYFTPSGSATYLYNNSWSESSGM